MAGWTTLVVLRRPGRALLALDLVVAVACQQASVLVLSADRIASGAPTVTVSWAAGPVAAWAVAGGWRAGGAAGLVVSAGAVIERGGASQATVNSCVLLVLLGTVVGYLVQLARRAEQAYAEAVRVQAETTERERLAREVHDGVLQALALVARRSADPELVSLATGQEQALRRLVAGPAVAPAGESNLLALLPIRPGVELAAPAEAVTLKAHVAAELAAAVGAAVDNALQHGGSTAWLLVDGPRGTFETTAPDPAHHPTSNETTPWGPIRRLHFPAEIVGVPVTWTRGTSALGSEVSAAFLERAG